MDGVAELAPAVRLALGHLPTVKPIEGDVNMWVSPVFHQGNAPFQDIMVGGIVRDANRNRVVLDDGTGHVHIKYAADLLPANSSVKLGTFLVVIGRIAKLCPVLPRVKASLVFPSPDDEPNAETLWMLEVADLHRRVYNTA